MPCPRFAWHIVVVITVVYSLAWSDVDPAGIDFDPEPARRIALELVARELASGKADRDALGEAIDQRLLAEYGAWVAGWQWSATEPGCGGPVRGWCCSSHSLLRRGESEPEASADRVVSAVTEWRDYLVSLAMEFAELHNELTDLALEDMVERSAARILAHVVERTGAEDAWYATFSKVLGWFLEFQGLHDAAVQAAIDSVVGTSFSSWVEPQVAVVRDTCAAIGLAVGEAARAPYAPSDALAAWLKIRPTVFKNAPGERPLRQVRSDSHIH